MNASSVNCMPIPFSDLIRRFEVLGSSYTSYPAPDRFVEAFSAEHLSQALAQRRNGAVAMALPLSLYVHIPFCESLCYYCSCSKIVTQRHEHGETYLRYLSREVELQTACLGVGQTVCQLYLGGGSPTFLSDGELRELMTMLRCSFTFAPDGEYTVEVDPRTVDATRVAVLAELGFNRLSFSVQDCDPAVQKAVHRVQTAEQMFSLIESARSSGFESVNVDLLYGLPLQTPKLFDRTLAQVIQLRPDRIALHAYVHRPQQFKPQRRISVAALPTEDARQSMLSRSLSVLQDAGYVFLGMDHFALPHDALTIAKRQGRLHRNFQGYSIQTDCDLIGLGVSAIGKVGAAYSQNAKTLEDYYDYLDQGLLPVVRGLALSRDDLVRRSVIMALICHGRLEFESINLAYLIDFKSYFAGELKALRCMQDEGLVDVSDTSLQMTFMGRYFVRGVAIVFDRYLQADRARARFSRII